MRETIQNIVLPEIEELPLKVVPDWDEKVEQATKVCRLIDKHLDFEAKGRFLSDRQDFRPEYLCPEQRVQMVTDLLPLAARR
jgi:hypothetical protein